MDPRPKLLRQRWMARFVVQIQSLQPLVDEEDAKALAFSCGAHTLILPPEEAAEVIAELLHRSNDLGVDCPH